MGVRITGSVCGLWLILSLFACGDDSSSDGAAGGPPLPMAVGDLCSGGLTCPQGTVCGSTGRLVGQCTATCNGDMGCLLLSPNARCANSQCAIRCTTDAECVAGTVCATVGGVTVCAAQ